MRTIHTNGGKHSSDSVLVHTSAINSIGKLCSKEIPNIVQSMFDQCRSTSTNFVQLRSLPYLVTEYTHYYDVTTGYRRRAHRINAVHMFYDLSSVYLRCVKLSRCPMDSCVM